MARKVIETLLQEGFRYLSKKEKKADPECEVVRELERKTEDGIEKIKTLGVSVKETAKLTSDSAKDGIIVETLYKIVSLKNGRHVKGGYFSLSQEKEFPPSATETDIVNYVNSKEPTRVNF